MEKVVTLSDRAREPQVPISTAKVAHLEIAVGGITCLHCSPPAEEGISRREPGPSATGNRARSAKDHPLVKRERKFIG